MKHRWLMGLFVVVALAWSCGSESGDKCVDHTDCPQAYICNGGSCEQQECAGHGECPSEFCGKAGIDPAQPDKRFCSPIECVLPTDCGPGLTCSEFKQCIADGSNPGDVAENDSTEDPTDVTVDPDQHVEPGELITKCIACTKDSDCEAGSTCKPMTNGQTYCFSECTSNDDCATGWMCYKLTDSGSQCIPMKFNCDATCLTAGCEAGKVCNQDTGECILPKDQCGQCTADYECGDGLRCNQAGKYCAPICPLGTECDAVGNSSCQEVNAIKIHVCVSASPDCCYGTQCAEACPPEKPLVKNGVCVQCLADSDCTTGKCSAANTCTSGTCTDPAKPYELNGVCYQCLEDGHCSSMGTGYKCVNKVCKPDTMPEECTYCTAPYPACVQINGIWSCVGCTDDTYCPEGVGCDTSLYACKLPDGPGGSCGTCTSDSQCTSTSGTWTDLKCDTASGCCYDAAGGYCDGVEAMCKGAAPCKSLLDLLGGMGGGMGGLPGMPTGGMQGVCSCTEPVSDIMALFPCLMGACPASGECVKGVCLDPALLTSLLGGGGGGGTSSEGLCVDPSGLLGGVF